MNEEQMQGQNVDNQMTPEEAKASLGLATRLGEQMLMVENPQMPEEEGGEQTTLQEPTEEKPEMDLEAMKSEMLESIKPQIQEIVKEEMTGLRQEIKDALDEEG